MTDCIAAYWVNEWTSSSENGSAKSLGLYIGIYFLLVVLATLGTFGECRYDFETASYSEVVGILTSV